jgi:hypothetical protein
MGINDKAFRLRGLRDRLHLRGRHECTFKQKIEIIVEVLGLVHSPRNLSWCRREATKLRDATPDPTPEQLALFGVLDDRLFKKSELIKARHERKKAAKAGRTKRRPQLTQIAPPAPVRASPMSVTEETSVTGEDTTSRDNRRPGDPDFRSVLEEFET